MDKMKKLLQKNSNDMVDLKRTNTENQANNRGLARPPFRRPYQPPQNQPPTNPVETLTSDEIYSILKALTTRSQTVSNDIRDSFEEAKDSLPPDEEHDQHLNTINFFLEFPMAEEEDEYEAIFNVKHSYNTRSKGQTS